MVSYVKKILIAALATALALTSAGCVRIRIGSGAMTEVSMDNIRSMTVDGVGNVYLLADDGLHRYALSGDKKLEYVFDNEDLMEAEFSMVDRGEAVTYAGFRPEKVVSSGDDTMQFLGSYTVNDVGRSCELFVIQDISNVNYTAAYFEEIERGGSPVVNGIGVAEAGMYLRLNRPYTERKKYDSGVHFEYAGMIRPFEMPENVIGAIDSDDGPYFLVGSDVIFGGESVYSFGDDVLKTFVSGEEVYGIYPDGKVVRWSAASGGKDYTDLGLKLDEVNDPFVWDGIFYWYDSEGVKTSK